jgi:conjugal transfer pilus assembly protein TraW
MKIININLRDKSRIFYNFSLKLMLLCFVFNFVRGQIMAEDANNKFDANKILKQSQRSLLDDFEVRYKKEVEPYLQNQDKQEGALKEARSSFYKSQEGQILVFISSSMSKVNIRSLLEEAKNIRASILLRGFIDNSFVKTTNYIQEYYSKDQDLGGILIDPESFKDFNVDSVPTFVLLEKSSKKGNKYRKLVGNITLSAASEILKKAPSDDVLANLGIYGTSFEIKEQDFEEMILGKLALLKTQGKIDEFNKALTIKITKRIQNPPKISGIEKARKNRKFLVDLSKVISQDIKDIRGNVIVKKGTRVNPLSHTEFSKDIYFIDGDDPKQIDWLKEQNGNSSNRIVILIGGRPIELQEELKERIYFDLRGDFSTKFNITKVPSIVRASKNMAEVEEVAI